MSDKTMGETIADGLLSTAQGIEEQVGRDTLEFKEMIVIVQVNDEEMVCARHQPDDEPDDDRVQGARAIHALLVSAINVAQQTGLSESLIEALRKGTAASRASSPRPVSRIRSRSDVRRGRGRK